MLAGLLMALSLSFVWSINLVHCSWIKVKLWPKTLLAVSSGSHDMNTSIENTVRHRHGRQKVLFPECFKNRAFDASV